MEFKISKEQIDELSRTNAVIKERLNEYFPEAFKTDLEVGKWYKLENNPSYLLNFQSNDKANNYGFVYWGWSNEWFFEDYHIGICQEATKEEVESALIAEAKKRGYKKGVTCVFGAIKSKRTISTNEIKWNPDWSSKGGLCMGLDIIFTDGKWAEIVPTEKTVITLKKALKILAKKMKVSPENIEIE